MNPAKGVAFKLVSAALFAVMSALIRYLGARYPIGQMVFYRSLFAIIPVVVVYAWRGELASVVRTERPLGQAGRGVLSIAGMFFNFGATARLPLVESNAIAFSSPLFTVALAALILNERVRIYRWSAVIIGFVGVLVVLSPHLSGQELAAAVGGGSEPDRRQLCDLRVIDQCGDRHSNPPVGAERIDFLDCVLFFAELHARGLGDFAIRLGDAKRRRTCRADQYRRSGRHWTYFSDPELSLRIRLAGRAIRLYLDDLGARVGVCDVRRKADFGDCAGFCNHRGGGAVRHLARTPACHDAPPRRTGDYIGRRRYDPPNALKVMMVRVSAIPGML